MDDQNLKNLFNENALKNIKDAAEALGFTNYEALNYALHLLQMAKAAKEQGKDFCVTTLDNNAGILMMDATISAAPNGGIEIGYNNRSKFKLPACFPPNS